MIPVPPEASRSSALRRYGGSGGVVLLALGAGVLGGIVARSTSSPTTSPRTPIVSPISCSVASVAAKDLPSIVTVSVRNQSGSSTGSGEVIRSGGYILTNNHVVAPAAKGGAISVLFDDGKSAPARLVGRDPLTDLAVLKVNTGRSLPAIKLGGSANLKVGEPVVVLGAPLGLSSTVTAGIVSALDRTIAVPGEGSTNAVLIDAIQTDAAINPGNSGGALVNCAGQLVGIPSAGATVPSATGEPANGGNIGLGFAIPIDLAKTISAELIANGQANHAYLGFDAEPLSSSTGQIVPGLYVTAVAAGGPADLAGVRVGDVVTRIDGSLAVGTDQLVELTVRHRPGGKVTLNVTRSGQSITVTLVLGSEP